jgi:hypothetical protein
MRIPVLPCLLTAAFVATPPGGASVAAGPQRIADAAQARRGSDVKARERVVQGYTQEQLEERKRQLRQEQTERNEVLAERRRLEEHKPLSFAECQKYLEDHKISRPARSRAEEREYWQRRELYKEQHGGQEPPDERCKFLWEQPSRAKAEERKAEQAAEERKRQQRILEMKRESERLERERR